MAPRIPTRRVRVVVAGAGLAGLTAARDLEHAGAEVTVVEARNRVGGRVATLRTGFEAGQRAELGADLIEAEQTHVLRLASELGLRTVSILRSGWGFFGTTRSGTLRIRRAPDTFERAAALLAPEIYAYRIAESQWTSGVAQSLARQSVAEWMTRARLDRGVAAGLRGLRGFYLADPENLALLVLVDQFAESNIPGTSRMYRLRDGNDALPAALAESLRGRVILEAAVRGIEQTRRNVRVAVESNGLHELIADYAVVALPASTLRDVEFRPALHDDQARAIASLDYGPATRVLLQFDRRFWKAAGRPSAFGSDQPFGAVWDANEHQSGAPGILTFLAGGGASAAIQDLVRRRGWPGLVRRLRWLGRPAKLLHAVSYTWEHDRWAKGGYAVFGPRFDPALRDWLPRPAGRIAFAGEHTSRRWQGFMNGAVESGRRAAIEIALIAGLDWKALTN